MFPAAILYEKKIDTAMYEDRVQKAKDLFYSGFNCSQSVVAAFADLYGFTPEQALRMSASFGGGIGRMRQTCGAACGLFMLIGLETGSVVGPDRAQKVYNYKMVQEAARKFREKTGSLICAELLQLRKSAPVTPQAEERTPEYYRTRPCARMIETAARLFADYLQEKEGNENPAAGRVQ